jgi:starvation-inducible DNA-binding protein
MPNDAANLQQLLADTVVLKWKAHNYHFNVTGLNFKQLHGLFQEFYEDLEEAADEIGEQIRILGRYTDVNLERFSNETNIEQVEGNLSATEMIRNLRNDNAYMISLLERLEREAESEAVLDFLVERHREHDMWSYMLNSHLEGF